MKRQLRCYCGTNRSNVPTTGKGDFVVCSCCNGALHPNCVQSRLRGKSVPENFACALCRLNKVDEFYPPVGPGTLTHTIASGSQVVSLNFNTQAALWKKNGWALHLRAVSMHDGICGGPAWPHQAVGKLNGRQCVTIEPPEHLHHRRERCYNLTGLLRQGKNTLELRFFPDPERRRDQPMDQYCVGVTVIGPVAPEVMVSNIRKACEETVESAKQRVRDLLRRAKEEEGLGECVATGSFGKILKPLCPISFCPIDEAAIGRSCRHVQVFDLNSYIEINHKMRALDKRWSCPVCSVRVGPDDIQLDPYAQEILDTMKGAEMDVEEVVFADDASWQTVSAAPEDDDDDFAPKASPAAMVDLSDSE